MITKTIKITMVEYTIFNMETDKLQTLTIDLIGTFVDEIDIFKALHTRILDHEFVVRAKPISVTTEKYGMSLDQFLATAVKLDD